MDNNTKKSSVEEQVTISSQEERKSALPVNRRGFLQVSMTLAAVAGASSLFSRTRPAIAAGVPAMDRSGVPDPVETDTAKVAVKYSVCLQCHSACGIKVKVSKSATPTILSIQGSPFHPNCVEEDENRLKQDAKPVNDPSVLKTAGTLCPKGIAGMEIIYNPHRILQPLKRKGARGSGVWEAISYKQAIQEIAKAIAPYWTRGPDPTFTGNKTPHYIDPNNTSLGFKNNQVAMYIGRLEHGQKEFTDRWFRYGFGSVNYRLDHTSICETSHHVAIDMALDGKKNHTKPDVRNARFIIAFGTNIFEAGFPQQALSRKFARAIKENNLEVAVVDPRFSKIASKAKHWLPLIPGTDAAVAFGIIRSWLDNSKSLETDTGNQVDSKFLRNATRKAAEDDGELNVSDATFLVRRDNKELYRDSSGNLYAWVGNAGKSLGKEPHKNTMDSVNGTLLTPKAGVTVGGVLCDSVFRLFYDEVHKHDVEGWARICGVPSAQITEVAKAMAAAGKKGSAEFYRGPAQHTNGTYSCLAIVALNTLRGNLDHKGGLSIGGGHYHEVGGGATGQYSLKKPATGAYAATGPRMDRAKADWAKYKGSENKPKRPWFPHSKYGVWQEVFPSIAEGYPYPIKALFSYWADPVYTQPAGRDTLTPILKDENALPLFVAFDNSFGATASLADYIIPDTTYLERWSTPHAAPTMLSKFSGFRQPMVGSYQSNAHDQWQSAVGTTWHLEDFWIGVAKELESLTGRTFPAIGKDGIAKGKDLNSAKDWFDAIVYNFAKESGRTEQSIREHGGVFADPGPNSEYDGQKLRARFGFAKTIRLYIERLAKSTDWRVDGTSSKFYGLPHYLPVQDILDKPVEDNVYEYPFVSVTYKPIQHKMGLTAVCPSLMMIEPENFVEINSADARTLDVETGDLVRITSPTNTAGVVGKVRSTETVRPGVVAVAMGFGNWEQSSRPHMINGKVTGFDPRRGRGLNTNRVLRLDPVLKDVCLQDKVGGSSSFFDTRVKITKVSQ